MQRNDHAVDDRLRVLYLNGRFYIRAGAGIVAESVPRSEWNETMNKARATFRAAAVVMAGLG